MSTGEEARAAAEKHQKEDLAFYSASVSAWYTTSVERDRGLLTLSGSAVGFLVAIVGAFKIASLAEFVFFVLSLLSFFACIASVLTIFQWNKKHLEAMIRDKARRDPALAALDRVAVGAFIAGVALFIVVGICLASRSLDTKEQSMPKDTNSGNNLAQDSFSGALNMSRPDVLQKSFDGASNMRPAPPAAQPQTSQPAQAPQTGTPAQETSGGSGSSGGQGQ